MRAEIQRHASEALSLAALHIGCAVRPKCAKLALGVFGGTRQIRITTAALQPVTLDWSSRVLMHGLQLCLKASRKFKYPGPLSVASLLVATSMGKLWVACLDYSGSQ